MGIKEEMKTFLDPLNKKMDLGYKNPVRILNDAGIRQALVERLIIIDPSFDLEKEAKRIQPATLDVKIKDVDEVAAITHDPIIFDQIGDCLPSESTALKARAISTINLTELIDFGQLTGSQPNFFGVMSELRSSVRRLGGYMANSGAYFFSGPSNSTLEIGNFSPNDILFPGNERFAQLFFTVKPFADEQFSELHPSEPNRSDLGEKVRTLEMGIEVAVGSHLHYLQQQGWMKISPTLKTSNGKILVHASDIAYRMKVIKGGIDFSKRDSYAKEMLLEQINISRGYTIRPFEHLIVETSEQFELSERVGVLFWDNLIPHVFSNHYDAYRPLDKPGRLGPNVGLLSLTDGWIDPGYTGGFSRQPKWLTGRTIYPGDIIGYGQVFFFPTGVNRSYGSVSLGSQYKGKKETQFSK